MRSLISSGSRAAATLATTYTGGARMPQDRRGIGRTSAGRTEGNIQQPAAFVSASHLPLKVTISSFSNLPLSAAQTFVQSLDAALTLGDAYAFDNLWTELQAKRDTEPTFCERVEACVNFYDHRSRFGVTASCAIAAEHCQIAWEAIEGSFSHPPPYAERGIGCPPLRAEVEHRITVDPAGSIINSNPRGPLQPRCTS